mgnify:CR=1 FL=1|jgi:hypothetical protein
MPEFPTSATQVRHQPARRSLTTPGSPGATSRCPLRGGDPILGGTPVAAGHAGLASRFRVIWW